MLFCWLLRKDICFSSPFFSGGGVLGMAVGSSIALDGAMKAALREATLHPSKHQTASPTLGHWWLPHLPKQPGFVRSAEAVGICVGVLGVGYGERNNVGGEEWVGVIFQYRPVSKRAMVFVSCITSWESSFPIGSGREWGQALSCFGQALKPPLLPWLPAPFWGSLFHWMWCARHGWWFANLPTFWSRKVGRRFFALPAAAVEDKFDKAQTEIVTLWKIRKLENHLSYLWALLVDGFGADITGWNWCWLPRWLKVKILHQKPRSWCVSQRGYRWFHPKSTHQMD